MYFALWLVTAAVSIGFAALPGSPVPSATFRIESPGLRGDSATLRVRVVIPPGWHIQSNRPLDDFLIPTTLAASAEGLRFGTPVYPKALEKDLPVLGGAVAVFEDTLDVRVPMRAERAGLTRAGLTKILGRAEIALRYQACNDSQCLPPRVIPARHEPDGS